MLCLTGTTKPNNEAKSLNKEELKEIEDELENNTAIIQEDNGEGKMHNSHIKQLFKDNVSL